MNTQTLIGADKSASATAAPTIRKLVIERFRGLQKFEWWPQVGTNLILGGGDIGKSTILDAIGLLLSPTNNANLSEADYWQRKVEDGFRIEAVMSLPDYTGIAQLTKNIWPWNWDGKEAVLPDIEAAPGKMEVHDPVYRVQVCGSPEFDLIYEIIQPDETTNHFPATVRRKIGIVRLSSDDRNDRDLRLVQGSGLDRLLSDKTLKARLQRKLATTDIEETLSEEAKRALEELDGAFKLEALPHGLGLGLVSGQSMSLNALVGLLATKDAIKLPLVTWGAGTRRLAALEISTAHHADKPIMLVDEVERGLEPYRQRGFMADLQTNGSQVFLTTHSAAALSAATTASVWYLDSGHNIGLLHADLSHHLRHNPEAFLSRLTIICEGPTEMGFVQRLLERAIGADLLAYGIWLVDGNGNEHTLKALDALMTAGLTFAGFADDEDKFPEKWARLQQKLGTGLFRWPKGCLEENLIALLPDEELEDFVADPEDELTGDRRRTLADRLKIAESDFPTLRQKAPNFRKLIVEAATGFVPDDRKDEKKILQKHCRKWFKSLGGGRELADKAFAFNLWPKLQGQLLPFCNAIRESVALPPITDITIPDGKTATASAENTAAQMSA